MNQHQRAAATRDSWRIRPCPDERAVLTLNETYSAAEFARIRAGWIPEEMDDKWFMFFEEPWLFIHRSWTGSCIYALRFQETPESANVVEAWASRDKAQYLETSADNDAKSVKYLIDVLLLERASR